MRFPRVLAMGVFMSLCVFAVRADARRVLADRIVAVVEAADSGRGETRIVLGSMLEAIARIRIVERRSDDLLWASLTPEYLAAVLNEIVNEILIYDEAARLGLDRIPAAEVEEERERLAARFEHPSRLAELLSAYDLGDEDLDELLSRRRVVRDFLAANVASTLRVDRGDATPDGVRDAVGAWVRELRGRARIRYLP